MILMTSTPTGPSAAAEPPRAETQRVSNRYGTVTNLAVHYNIKKSLFAGTRKEDLAMRHVVAARLETSRHPILGAVFLVVGLIVLLAGFSGGSPAAVLGIILLLIAGLLLWGSPRVAVTASDGVQRPSVSWPWTRPEAEAFVGAVSNELMARG